MTETKLHYLDTQAVDALVARARTAPRRRQNLNIHQQPSDPIQRLLNAGEPDTYVRPHRHGPGRWEFLTVLRGQVDALLFDDAGAVTQRFALPAGSGGIEVPAEQWHGFVFVTSGTVALEIKPGPYDAATDKEFAAWAPPEDDPAAPLCRDWLAGATTGARFRHPDVSAGAGRRQRS